MTEEQEQTAEVLAFRFETEDLRKLLADNPDYIIVSSEIRTRDIGGKQAAVLFVDAIGYDKVTKNVTSRAPGCPVPPCTR